MNLDSCLILGREDLSNGYKDIDIIEIEYIHFKHLTVDDLYKKQPLVLFIDNNSETKILKNRYGYEGLVVK